MCHGNMKMSKGKNGEPGNIIIWLIANKLPGELKIH